jgi:hypothetical protein
VRVAAGACLRVPAAQIEGATMHTLASLLSDNGKQALATLTGVVRAFPEAEQLAENFALELAGMSHAESEAELRRWCEGVADLLGRDNPALRESTIKGMMIGFCELVTARRQEVLAHEAGRA